MNVFNKIFGNDVSLNEIPKVDWFYLEDIKGLDKIQKKSFYKPIVIFKHCTSCSVSRMALKSFENEFDSQNDIETYFLDLLAFRAISNEIASKFDVVHQSPQLLLIKNGKCIYDVSHSDIDALELKKRI